MALGPPQVPGAPGGGNPLGGAQHLQALQKLYELADIASPDMWLAKLNASASPLAPQNTMRTPADFKNPQTTTPIADQIFGTQQPQQPQQPY